MSSSRAAQIAAVKELREYDHAFLPKDIVRKLVKPFGLKVQSSTEGSNICPAGTPEGVVETYIVGHNLGRGKHSVTLPAGMAFMEGSDFQSPTNKKPSKGTGWIAWKPGRSRSRPRASEPAVRVAGRTTTLAWKVPPTYRERKLRDTKQGGARGPRKRSK
jgi:hypothetical protein